MVNTMNKEYDLIVIGGGSAGLAAAVGAYDAGIKSILLIERMPQLGGILNQCIHNGFGLHTFKEELTGPEYAHRFINELHDRNIEFLVSTTVLSVTKTLNVTISNEEIGVTTLKAKAIVNATGCNERTFGQIMIPGDRPNGVFTAGLAQKYLNLDGYLVGKKVYILGSGDIGLIMARRMTLEGANVIGVSELMPYSNGLNRNIVQCLNDFNIPLHLHNTVTKIIGKDQLEAIETMDVGDDLKPIPGTMKHIECDTLLLSVGLYPFNTLLQQVGASVYTKTKGAFVDQNLETTIPGIFSCGNVLHVHDLVDFVSQESTRAGKNAADFIEAKRGKLIKTLYTNALDGVGYLLPNMIHVYSNLNEVTFSFRVRKPMQKAILFIKDGDNVIKKITKVNLVPSEMQMVTLKDINFAQYDEIDFMLEEVK